MILLPNRHFRGRENIWLGHLDSFPRVEGIRAGARKFEWAGGPGGCTTPEAPPAKAPASTEQVSISLPDLPELKNHVGTEKQEGLQQLKQRAAEHPEEQVKLKRDILNLTGAGPCAPPSPPS